MSMSWTRRFEDAPWDRFLEGCPEATVFHTRAWARVLMEGFPRLADRSLLHAGEAGTSRYPTIQTVLPLFAWRRAGGILTTLHSSFPFLYGGPVPWPPDGEPGSWLARVRAPGASARIQSNPFAREAARPPEPVPPGWRLSWDRTHVLELPPDEEAFWEKILTTQKRNDIRRLGKKGVEVSMGDGAPAVREVYGLYLRRVASWARKPGMVYPESFYGAMRSAEGIVRLYTVRHGGRLIGGTFVARWGDKLHYVAGYYDDDARSLRPNVIVQDRIIRDGIRDGFRYYDMLPSAGLRNVETFKESFGSRPVPFWRLERLGTAARWIRRIRGGGPAD